MKIKFLLLILIIVLPVLLISQTEPKKINDSLKRNRDSIVNNDLNIETQKILITDSLRKVDSLNMAKIILELDKYKSTDNLKKEELLKEIGILKYQDSLKKAVIRSKIDSLKSINPGYPVTLRYDTLFVIYSGVGSFQPQERANAISSKILTIAKRNDYDSNKLIIKNNFDPEIYYENIVLLSVTDEDALWNNTDKESLTAEIKKHIAQSIQNYKDDTSLTSWLIRIGKSISIIIVLIIILKIFAYAFKKFRIKILSYKDTFFKGLKIKSYQLLDSTKQVNVILTIVKIFKWFIYFLLIYFALLLLFGVFPETKVVADTLLRYIIIPLKKVIRGFINFIPNLFAIIVIIIITRYIIKFINYIGSEIEKGNLKIKGFYPDWTRPTLNIIKVVIYAFMFIVVFPYLPGSDSPIFQGVSVFLGVLFSLGSTSAISNMIAGLVITYMRPFKIGDRVRLGDVTGDIIEKGILVTRVRTIKNEDITIPNSTILSGHTINYSTSSESLGLILYTTVTIGYDVNWQTVHKLLIEAALKTVDIDKNKMPFVLQTSLDDYYVSYQINLYTSKANSQASIYSDLHKNIQNTFNEAGVEIMSPHYKALRDGNLTTIPKDYLSSEYRQPDFNINMKNKDDNSDNK